MCASDLYKGLSVCVEGTGLAKQADLRSWIHACLLPDGVGMHILTSHYFLLPLSIYSDNSLQIPAHTVGGSPGLTAP